MEKVIMWIRIKNKAVDVIVYMSIKFLFELIFESKYTDTLQTLIKSFLTSLW